MTSGEEKALLAILAERIEQARARGGHTTVELMVATQRADMLALATLAPKPDELRCQCVASHAHRRWGDFVVGPRCAADAVTTVIKRGEHGGVELRMCRECSDFHAKPEPKRGVEEILVGLLAHLEKYLFHATEEERVELREVLRLYREERERVANELTRIGRDVRSLAYTTDDGVRRSRAGALADLIRQLADELERRDG